MSRFRNPVPKFLYNDGTPLVKGLLYFYESNTAIEKDTFSDSALKIANTNPVELYANGDTPNIFYAGDAKVILTDSAFVQLWERDPVTSGEWSIESDPIFLKDHNTDGSHIVYESIADLRASTLTPFDGQKISATNYHSTSIGGGGDFYWNASSTETDDNGTIIKQTDTTTGRWIRIVSGLYYFQWFGCIADGATDSGVYLNYVFEFLRNNKNIAMDGSGGDYVTTISINATNINSLSEYGVTIQNLNIIGKCLGKAVLDLAGTRGYALREVHILGDEDDMPSIGLLAARTITVGFCGNALYDNVTCQGWYSEEAVYIYAQEVTTYQHCRWWNNNPDGMGAVLIGNDTIVASSDYATLLTGPRSYIANKYINCEFRYLPVGNTYSITDITQANPAVVTVSVTHHLTPGERVCISSVVGMNEIENLEYTVGAVTSDTFELAGTDSTLYGAYISGGTAVKSQSLPTVVMNKMEQHDFDSCYVVNYGSDNIEYQFVDTEVPENLKFNIVCEGIASRSHLRFTGVVANDRRIFGFDFEIYNTFARLSLFSSDATTGSVQIRTCNIAMNSNVKQDITVFHVNSVFSLHDADVHVPLDSQFDPTAMLGFGGKWYSQQNDDIHYVGREDGDFVPVITSQGGALTTVTLGHAKEKSVSGGTLISIKVTITDVGTGTGFLNIALPFDYKDDYIWSGRVSGTGEMLQCELTGTPNIEVRVYDNTTTSIMTSGRVIWMSGVLQKL